MPILSAPAVGPVIAVITEIVAVEGRKAEAATVAVMKIPGKPAAVEIPTAVAAVEISASEVAAVSEMTATAAHTAKVAAATAAMTTATAASSAATPVSEGVMGDRDAAKSENRHDGRNFV
jgi:hypothetical protein